MSNLVRFPTASIALACASLIGTVAAAPMASGNRRVALSAFPSEASPSEGVPKTGGRIARAFSSPVIYLAVDRLPAANSPTTKPARGLELPSSLLTDPVAWRALGLDRSATERPLALLRKLLDRQRPLLAGRIEFALIGYDEQAGRPARPELAFVAGLGADGHRAVRRFLGADPARSPGAPVERRVGSYRVWQLGAVRSTGFIEVALVTRPAGVDSSVGSTELIVTNSSTATDRLLGVVSGSAVTEASSAATTPTSSGSWFRSARAELFGAEPTPVGALWAYIDRPRLARAVRGRLASGLLAKFAGGTSARGGYSLAGFDSLAVGVAPHESGLRSTLLVRQAEQTPWTDLLETARIRDLVTKAPAWALAPRVGAASADGFVGGVTLAFGPQKLQTMRDLESNAVRGLLQSGCGQLGLSWEDAVGRLGRVAGLGWFAASPRAPLETVHGLAARSAPAARMLRAELGRAAKRHGAGGRSEGDERRADEGRADEGRADERSANERSANERSADDHCVDLRIGNSAYAVAEHQAWLLFGAGRESVRSALPHAKRRQRSARRAGLLSDLKRISSASQRVSAIVSIDTRGWAKGLGEASILHARHSGYVAFDPGRLRLELLTQRPH